MNPITHSTFRHCRVRFRWTTFLETAVYVKYGSMLGPVHTYPDIFESAAFPFRIRLPSGKK